jgi:hypothetical protein
MVSVLLTFRFSEMDSRRGFWNMTGVFFAWLSSVLSAVRRAVSGVQILMTSLRAEQQDVTIQVMR